MCFSSANQNLMNVTCESNSENGSEHSVDLCSIDGPACVTLSKGRKQPDVQCEMGVLLLLNYLIVVLLRPSVSVLLS